MRDQLLYRRLTEPSMIGIRGGLLWRLFMLQLVCLFQLQSSTRYTLTPLSRIASNIFSRDSVCFLALFTDDIAVCGKYRVRNRAIRRLHIQELEGYRTQYGGVINDVLSGVRVCVRQSSQPTSIRVFIGILLAVSRGHDRIAVGHGQSYGHDRVQSCPVMVAMACCLAAGGAEAGWARRLVATRPAVSIPNPACPSKGPGPCACAAKVTDQRS